MDAPLAQKAVLQIEVASETLRDGGRELEAVYFEQRLTEARRVRDTLQEP
jgi:hypothetical protein